jgi:hypothetical protein
MTNDEMPELIKLDMELVKKNIPDSSSEKLCEMIVCDRYLGFGDKVAPYCMEELAKRRINGDTFDFEDYIEKSQKELPVLDFNLDLRTTLQQAINSVKKIVIK